MKNYSASILTIFAVSLLALTGCSDSGEYKVVEIAGTVTYEGEPVGNIGLIFTPAEGRPSLAVTDDSGKFSLYYTAEQSGAQVGTHQVIFEFPPTPLDGSLPEETEPTEAIKAIMASYGPGGSPLTVEVTEANKDFKIALPQ